MLVQCGLATSFPLSRRGFPLTNVLLPLLRRSWPFLVEISCLIAPPCPDFWRLSTSPRWRRFARSFTRICWPASHSLLSAVWLTRQAGGGGLFTRPEPARPALHALCRQRVDLRLPPRRLTTHADPGTTGPTPGE